MNNKWIKGLLREALGVPENITKLARWTYGEFLNKFTSEISKINIGDYQKFDSEFTLNGNFNIADYRFSTIKILYDIELSDKITNPIVYSMSFRFESELNANTMRFRASNNLNIVTLVVNIAIGRDNTNKDIINLFETKKNMYSSSFAHELKHAYDTYKNRSGSPVKSNAEYQAFSNVRFDVKPVDRFIHNLYFTHMVENLVRTTEIAMDIESENINKKNFIEFLSNNKTYQTLKTINSFSVNGFRNELLGSKQEIIDAFNNSDVEIPETDEALVDRVLELLFINLQGEKINVLKDLLSDNNPFNKLFNVPNPHEKFISNYINKTRRFKNHEEYFAYEEKMFKFVSENLIRKINKLYAMAKDDENISKIMQKINDKPTNESILDWDLHYDVNKIPVKKFKQ